MKAALRTHDLSKHYRLGAHGVGGYRTLRESLNAAVLAPWRRLSRVVRRGIAPRNGTRPYQPDTVEDILWALKDVSFEVQPGEVVGIVGRNGAGKSTLLKLLSRITEPSYGRAELRGRIGSLLEVGTGFHPELTGRENIFLNGAVLGMSRQEVGRKFDEIVAFAEIEPFLDTPVKRYSSGMYVRLAFAVAAHLEPEILVVDEVLAVGDVAFQKKCLQRMQDAGREGRTILFVSHNLAALQMLCGRAIVLDRGRLVKDGPTLDAVGHYLRSVEAAAAADLSQRTDRHGAGQVRLRKVEVCNVGPAESGQLVMGSPARFRFHVNRALPGVTCFFSVYDSRGSGILWFNSALSSLQDSQAPLGEPVMTCTVEELLLAPGRYRIDVAIRAASELQDRVEAAAFFEVIRGPIRGREPPRRVGDWVVCLPHHWQNLAC